MTVHGWSEKWIWSNDCCPIRFGAPVLPSYQFSIFGVGFCVLGSGFSSLMWVNLFMQKTDCQLAGKMMFRSIASSSSLQLRSHFHFRLSGWILNAHIFCCVPVNFNWRRRIQQWSLSRLPTRFPRAAVPRSYRRYHLQDFPSAQADCCFRIISVSSPLLSIMGVLLTRFI